MATEQNTKISEVVEQEGKRLLNFIRRSIPDDGEAEDLLQDVYYQLIEQYRSMKPIGHMTGWLYRVTRNRITDWFRKKRSITESALEAPGEEDYRFLDSIAASANEGSETTFTRQLILDALSEALEELPEEQRDVFVWHELEGRPFAEISKETGIKVNTLISRKRYAILYLREQLEEVYRDIFLG